MAALLYLGAGIGIGILSLFNKKDREKSERLSKKDLPFVIGMIVLDIAAPIFLMLGISYGSSANASLLGNFEIVATTVIALFIFKEAVSKRLWAAIALITLSSILLSFEGTDSFSFSCGSLFVLAATVCWGFENNCTRNISSKSTYEIVVLKGVFSGLEIESAEVPASVYNVGMLCFRDCKNLKKVTLTEGLVEIGGGAFEGCESLEEISLPSTLRSIGPFSFDGCVKLDNIVIPDGIVSWGVNPFRDTQWYKGLPDGDVYAGKTYLT